MFFAMMSTILSYMAIKVISTEELSRGAVDKADLELQGIRQRAEESVAGILPVYKKYGETPLECLNRLRVEFPVLKNATLSYAGRLDPLAEGLMLILVGKEANQNRRAYLQLGKVYEVEVLFGLSSDTGDVLGMPKNVDLRKDTLTTSGIRQVLDSLKGRQYFHYPVFSSRTVGGKPLFEWAKEKRLDEIVVPKTEINIEDIALLDSRIIEASAFFEQIKKSIALVNGDFRQEQILSGWDEVFIKKVSRNANFFACKIKVKCSAGSYMRTLSEEIGNRLGVPALACGIKRVAIGDIAGIEGIEV